jgi:hypothetical protein
MTLNLTAEEGAELHARPIGAPEWRNLTEQQLLLRIEIAKKMWLLVKQADPTLQAWHIELYERMPPWGFYVDAHSADCWPPRRIFGLCRSASEPFEQRVHNVTLMIAMNNATLGGTPVTELRRVERWSEAHIRQMCTGWYKCIGLFEDPLGFMVFGHGH